MNPFEQMQLKQGSFTATDWQVYDAINANIDAVFRGTATLLAEELGVSQAALTRFCKKLGYNGFSDFKMAAYQYHKAAATQESPSTAIEYYVQLLQRIPAAMEEADIDALVERLVSSRMVLTSGNHKSALSAQLMAYNLIKFGIVSHFWSHDMFASIEQVVTDKDTLVIFSATSRAFRPIFDFMRDEPPEHQPYTVLVTMNNRNPPRTKVDQVIWLPNYQNQNYPQYLESQVTFMVFIDLLTNVIAQRLSTPRA